MTHQYRAPMNHTLTSVSPSVQGLNQVILTGELQSGSYRPVDVYNSRRVQLFQGQMIIRADPARLIHSAVVPVYATDEIGRRLEEARINGRQIEVHGIAHQHNRTGDGTGTRVKVLTFTPAQPGQSDRNRCMLGGTICDQGPLTHGPGGLPYITFDLAINADYRQDNGEWVIRDDRVQVCAHGEQARIIDRLAPGTTVTVEASVKGVYAQQRTPATGYPWRLHFTALRLTHGLKVLWTD